MLKHDPHSIGLWQILIESDLLNIILLTAAIVYLGNKFLPKIIEQRKNQITSELEDAKKAKQKAEKELKEVKEKTKNILNEVNKIKEEARNTASILKKQIEADTEKELENLKAKVKTEISTIHDQTIEEIRREISNAALKLAEQTISKLSKNKEIKDKLTEEFLKELKEPSRN